MKSVQKFWSDFCKAEHMDQAQYQDAFQFGVEADWLADLVMEGKKTATTSGHVFYELEGEQLPQAGEFYIVLDSHDVPAAIIQIESVEVLPMDKVSEAFALAEGEGDYQHWWEAHEKFFTDGLRTYGKTFSRDMLVVCERFKKVYPK